MFVHSTNIHEYYNIFRVNWNIEIRESSQTQGLPVQGVQWQGWCIHSLVTLRCMSNMMNSCVEWEQWNVSQKGQEALWVMKDK